eukprot:SAG25_NODE_643_length_6222_cov_3.565246_3_plen_144_part_00
MPKLEKTMLKDIKTSAPRTMQAFVTFMESQRTDPELWFSTLVANLPQGTVLTSELAQINKQAVSYWVRYKQLHGHTDTGTQTRAHDDAPGRTAMLHSGGRLPQPPISPTDASGCDTSILVSQPGTAAEGAVIVRTTGACIAVW